MSSTYNKSYYTTSTYIHTYIEILVRVLHLYKICNQKPEIPILTPIKKIYIKSKKKNTDLFKLQKHFSYRTKKFCLFLFENF